MRIVFRGDCGFCRWKTLQYCDKNDIGYGVRLAKNERLEQFARPLMDAAIYPQRGEIENRIKQQQLCLFADRTRCNKFVAKQLGLLLASSACGLIEHLRREGLKNTELAKARVDTIRLKLLKVAARVVVRVRRVMLHLGSSDPYRTRLVRRRVPS